MCFLLVCRKKRQDRQFCKGLLAGARGRAGRRAPSWVRTLPAQGACRPGRKSADPLGGAPYEGERCFDMKIFSCDLIRGSLSSLCYFLVRTFSFGQWESCRAPHFQATGGHHPPACSQGMQMRQRTWADSHRVCLVLPTRTQTILCCHAFLKLLFRLKL